MTNQSNADLVQYVRTSLYFDDYEAHDRGICALQEITKRLDAYAAVANSAANRGVILQQVVEDHDRRLSSRHGRFLLWMLRKTT